MKITGRLLGPLTVIVFLVGTVMLIAVCAVAGYVYVRQQRARAEFAPPTVWLTAPKAETPAYAGSHLPVAATAFGRRPIAALGLWLDGIPVEKQPNSQLESISPFSADFDVLLTEGPHMMFVRAIDEKGLVGKSSPISIVAAPAGGSVSLSVPEEAPIPAPDVPMLTVSNAPRLFSFAVVESPAAPTGLEAGVENCQVKLVWNDNASNEAGYEVWLASLGLPSRRIASLAPAGGGAVWFQFPAPGPGFHSVWVEAVNLLGGQPSNPAWIAVGAGCPNALATQLQIEALDMTVSAEYDRVYCYVSFEGAPEQRVPSERGAFIQVRYGKGDIGAWGSGSRKGVIPIPVDGSLELSGECWGWSGAALNKLGSFSTRLPSEMWDGSLRLVDGGGFKISILAAMPGAMEVAEGRVTYADRSPGLPGAPASGGWLSESPPAPPKNPATVIVSNASGVVVDAVYMRLHPGAKDYPEWGNNWLGPQGPLGLGLNRTMQLESTSYDLRAICCNGQVLDEKLDIYIGGTYKWDLLSALDVHNDVSWPYKLSAVYFSTTSDWGNNRLGLLPGSGHPQGTVRRFYLIPGTYNLKAVSEGLTSSGAIAQLIRYCDQVSINGVVAWFVYSEMTFRPDVDTYPKQCK